MGIRCKIYDNFVDGVEDEHQEDEKVVSSLGIQDRSYLPVSLDSRQGSSSKEDPSWKKRYQWLRYFRTKCRRNGKQIDRECPKR